MSEKITLGTYLRKLRKDKNYSLRKVEELSGVSYSHLSKIERDEHIPTKDTIEQLAKALDVDEYEMLILAGHSTDADMKFWAGLFNTIDMPWVFKRNYLDDNGNPDIYRFRNEFVHGMITDDDISEKISTALFERYTEYQDNMSSYTRMNRVRQTEDVSTYDEENYGEWYDFIELMKRSNITPEKAMNMINFAMRMKEDFDVWYRMFKF